jgi:hypothetical protein
VFGPLKKKTLPGYFSAVCYRLNSNSKKLVNLLKSRS